MCKLNFLIGRNRDAFIITLNWHVCFEHITSNRIKTNPNQAKLKQSEHTHTYIHSSKLLQIYVKCTVISVGFLFMFMYEFFTFLQEPRMKVKYCYWVKNNIRRGCKRKMFASDQAAMIWENVDVADAPFLYCHSNPYSHTHIQQ